MIVQPKYWTNKETACILKFLIYLLTNRFQFEIKIYSSMAFITMPKGQNIIIKISVTHAIQSRMLAYLYRYLNKQRFLYHMYFSKTIAFIFVTRVLN